ncbi:MAG: glucose 1-dehydrogenase [Chloroflexi bacterium]|nr:glucose 1-dehydrogenase [Chloroflexota bacterium]MCI0576046.1 glucose 1-dehydrogenase [Chloroflexota bacterium]MCI0647834.1 glucose 1-dehydrogenase [Chloroflexota bacterium]MCI0727085.1 glucose 1-dehydrogenase [Chloroflexota bacterium]
MTKFDLSEKVAIVTGASRGIGEAIARAYVQAGASVVISSRKMENVGPVAEAINAEHPGQALAVAAHAGQRADTQALIEQAVAHFGRVDIAVNNAGTNPHFGPLLTAEESHWDKIFEVNVKGYFWLCQAAARQMQAQGTGGKLINVASIAGLSPGPMMGVYSVSKAAVIMMTKALAVELGPNNIQVNAIAPGFVKTKFSRALWDNPVLYASLVERTPAGRMAEPEEVAGIALYLASPAADFTTGGVFTVDGGYILS